MSIPSGPQLRPGEPAATEVIDAHEPTAFRYGGAAGRRAAILQKVRQLGYVSFGDLSTELEVSERTVRRDLIALADQGAVTIVPGGATLPTGVLMRAPFHARAVNEATTKAKLAKLARTLVSAGDAVALDAGSTISMVATELVSVSPLTVISHSLEVINQFSGDSGVSMIGVGGSLDTNRRAFFGPMTRENLESMRVTTAFLACSGVHSTGFACASQTDAEIKRTLLGIAEQKILVATSSVFSRVAPVRMSDFSEIDIVITDSGLEDHSARALESAGVRILMTDP